MGLAVLLCWAVGLVACTQPGRLGRVPIKMRVLRAMVQIFVVPHVAAGLFGVLTCRLVGREIFSRSDGMSAEVSGFAITLLTALPLLMAAFIFGGGHTLFTDPPAGTESADYADGPRPPAGPPPA